MSSIQLSSILIASYITACVERLQRLEVSTAFVQWIWNDPLNHGIRRCWALNGIFMEIRRKFNSNLLKWLIRNILPITILSTSQFCWIYFERFTVHNHLNVLSIWCCLCRNRGKWGIQMESIINGMDARQPKIGSFSPWAFTSGYWLNWSNCSMILPLH